MSLKGPQALLKVKISVCVFFILGIPRICRKYLSVNKENDKFRDVAVHKIVSEYAERIHE
jgi:hypothetical protein